MFTAKQKSLIEAPEKKSSVTIGKTMVVSENPFVREAFKQSVETTLTGNGALKYKTTGSDFVDQFASATKYKQPRSYEEISVDMQKIWNKNQALTVAFVFYLRMITRIVQFFDGSKTATTQRGQGLKHEGIFRMIWLSVNAPDAFWRNILLFISVGSWKDIITMLSYDLQWNGWKGRVLDWHKFGQIILAGLENPNTSELVKKYLPQIKAKSQCRTLNTQADTIIGKWICSLLFGGKAKDTASTYKLYRKLKSSGTAHEWQQLISQGKFLEINFDSVHGRALAQLVSSKFLQNNNLEEKYEQWIASKPIAKYTGYVYELLGPVKSGYVNIKLKKYQEDTINKQFYGMIETGKKGMNTNSSLIVVLDTSSSMTSTVPGTKVSAYDIGKSMALYFSYLLEGPFKKAWMEFADGCRMNYWHGDTPVENLQNDRSEAYGSTNFQAVGKTFVSLLKKIGSEKEFPTGILCISDGCFNSVGKQTNYQTLLKTLAYGGFSKEYVDNFKVILWDIPNNYYGKPTAAFEEFADCPNMMHISGLDGSAIAFITGTDAQKDKPLPKTSEELFLAAMDQEVLNLIEV